MGSETSESGAVAPEGKYDLSAGGKSEFLSNLVKSLAENFNFPRLTQDLRTEMHQFICKTLYVTGSRWDLNIPPNLVTTSIHVSDSGDVSIDKLGLNTTLLHDIRELESGFAVHVGGHFGQNRDWQWIDAFAHGCWLLGMLTLRPDVPTLSKADFEALNDIRMAQVRTHTGLAYAMNKTPPDTLKTLMRLTERGLVVRESASTSNKNFPTPTYSVSPLGMTLLSGAFEVRHGKPLSTTPLDPELDSKIRDHIENDRIKEARELAKGTGSAWERLLVPARIKKSSRNGPVMQARIPLLPIGTKVGWSAMPGRTYFISRYVPKADYLAVELASGGREDPYIADVGAIYEMLPDISRESIDNLKVWLIDQLEALSTQGRLAECKGLVDDTIKLLDEMLRRR